MLERGRKIYLEMDKKNVKQYVVEQAEDGRIVLLACGSETADFAEKPQTRELRDTATLAEYAREWLDVMKYQVKESTYIKYWTLLYSYIIPS